MVEEGETETERHTKTRKCYHHSEGTKTGYSKNVQLKHHLQECVNAGAVPTWMTEGRTVLIMKDKNKGTVVGNYRPIACLPLM